MSLAQLVNREATIVRRTDTGATDELGNATPTETDVEVVCEVQQKRREEGENLGEVSESDWLGIFPAGTELDTSDAVIVHGLATFELVGAPWPARNPRTQSESHLEATLRWVSGAEDES